MAEYIKKSAADDALRERAELYDGHGWTYAASIINGDRSAIISVPPADVRENVRGEWIEDGFLDRKTCSVCGAWIANNTGTAVLNYCPNCGADLRGIGDG